LAAIEVEKKQNSKIRRAHNKLRASVKA